MDDLRRQGWTLPDIQVLQECLLQRNNHLPLRQWPHGDRMLLRSTGYMETTAEGLRFIRGARMEPTTAEVHIHSMRRHHQVDVRVPGFEWSAAQKRQCPQWRAVKKYVNQTYGINALGRPQRLTADDRAWLRIAAVQNPQRSLNWLHAMLFQERHVLMSAGRISEILREDGLSRQRIQYIASQRFTPNNLYYARLFNIHLMSGSCQRPAWFDESGINKVGMSHRRSDGWNVVGAGGAFLCRPLQYWGNENITVMAFQDRTGVFMVDVHTGGTDVEYVRNYMFCAADALAARGVDSIVLDNCLAHKAWLIMLAMNRRGIAVIFLPRYWPSYNPIELVWNWMKDYFRDRMDQLRRNPVAVIEAALNTVDGALSRSFIRKCRCYPASMSDLLWNGPGPQ